MTPDEISAWKAEQTKRPLAERLADVAGHRIETPQVESSSPELTQAEVGYAAAKDLLAKKS